MRHCKAARAAAPPGLEINELFDQSVFVKQAVVGVVREGAIAAGLTAMMILLFLGSWRSTLVVMISIPLAILSSLVVLYFLGDTLNTMTLGGLALAVGILVDDSTVTIENTHRLLTEEKQPLPQATLHGSAGIAVPTLVSTLAISCVFTSVVFLEGPAKYLFTPLGLAVVFAMLASYGLSRTLTPITIGLLLKNEHHGPAEVSGAGWRSWFGRFHAAFERGFEHMRAGYAGLLTTLLRRRLIVPAVMVLVLALGAAVLVLVGRDFFPAIDGGLIELHVRAPAGTRIESTERIFQAVEDKIREIIPDNERQLIVDNIGLPARAYNLAFSDGSTIGVNDGVIQVQLKDGHAPTSRLCAQAARRRCRRRFPTIVFYFQAADIVTQILNFGLPAQIDVRTVGYDRATNLRVANELAPAHRRDSRGSPMRICSRRSTRRRSTPRSTARGRRNSGSMRAPSPPIVNVSLSSSEQVTPNFWTDPKSGIPYYLAVQTPEHDVSSFGDLGNTPVSSAILGRPTARCPGCSATWRSLKRDSVPTNANQANIQPVYEVYAGVQGRDLGSVSARSARSWREMQKQLTPGNTIQVIGQIDSMNEAFRDLGIGLLFAAVFVYLLMVVNYQNFGDPLVVILALPATLCGILTMLFITNTTLNVPSLMGAIMAVGVASANSILLVTFAREQQLAGKTAFEAAIDAGHTRIRPVLMTAAAMIVGMLPMATRGSRRGAERRPGARRHRRPAVRNPDHAACRALPVRAAAEGE